MGGVSSEKSCPHREQGGDAHRPCSPKVPPAYSLQPVRQFSDFSCFVCARLGSVQVPHCGCEPAYSGNTPRDQCCRLDERSHHPPLIIPEWMAIIVPIQTISLSCTVSTRLGPRQACSAPAPVHDGIVRQLRPALGYRSKTLT